MPPPAPIPPHPLPRPARRLAFGALRHRNYRLFFGGQLVSLVGTWMTQIAQGWLVLDLTDSPFYVGVVAALGSLPVLVLTLFAGVVADRVDRRRLVVGTQLGGALQSTALFIIVVTHVATVEQVMVLATFQGMLNAFDIPARQALLVELVGPDDLTSAVALNSGAFNAARVVGPAIAGLIIGRIGLAACFLIDAVSYAAVLVSLLRIRLPATAAPPSLGPWRNLAEGLSYVAGERRVRVLVALTATYSIFGFPFLVLMPVVARDVLRVGAEGYGWLMASVGIGALVGALALAAAANVRRGPVLVAAGLALSFLLGSFALVRSVALAMPLLAGIGFAMILNNATTNTMLQLLVPNALRGRVMAVYTFMFVGMAPIGAFLAGFIADRWGAPMAIGLGAAVCGAAILLVVVRAPAVRRL